MRDRDDTSKDRSQRPSWRELDRRKDRSPHTGQHEPPGPKSPRREYEEAKKKKAALSKLDALFVKKQSPEETKAIYRLHGAVSAEFRKELQSYKEKFGYPKDWGVLLQILDFGDADEQLAALSAIRPAIPAQSPAAKDQLRSKLSILRSTSFDDRVLDMVDQLERELSS